MIGADGVGHDLHGRRVFFTSPVSPHGSWAERTVVAEEDLLDLADDVDDVTAAALGNTGLAAWLALTWRANLQPGQNVLVLGATGALGSIAVQLAKALGAATVVAADRDPGRLALSRRTRRRRHRDDHARTPTSWPPSAARSVTAAST